MRELKINKSITYRDHDTLTIYLQDINKYSLLTAEEEVQLAVRIREGDEAALERLVNANLRFVVSVAKKYEGQGILLPDLISEGNFGLMKAARRFDYTKGFKFISYAVWWVRQTIMSAINEYRRMIRLPVNKISELSMVWKAQQELEQKLERPATFNELVEHTSLTIDKIFDCFAIDGHTLSLDDANPEQDRPGLLAFLEDPMFADADLGLILEGLSAELEGALKVLPDRQQRILELNYGLKGEHLMFVEDVADRLGVTSQCVLSNKAKGLETLRTNNKVRHLKEYLSH
jgi:RNA polymerase primary sigma factor